MKVSNTQVPPISVGLWNTQYASHFEIHREDGALHGRVQISAGGVGWKPSGGQSWYWLDWDRLAALMQQGGDAGVS